MFRLGAKNRPVIPISGEIPLPWDYFLTQAAIGGARVPEWLMLAVPEAIGLHHGIPSDDVTGEHVDNAMANLPTDPMPYLRRVFSFLDLATPQATDPLRLEPEAARGSGRSIVSQADLLHDAAVLLLQDYGAERFFSLCDEVLDHEDWDARCAVAAMLYLNLVRGAA